MPNTYGYIRVSTKEQNEARQLDALAPYSIPEKNLYMDKQSGKSFDRPAWRKLVKRLRPGDLLIVKSIDRLGRNYDEILEQWRDTHHPPQAAVTEAVTGNEKRNIHIEISARQSACEKRRNP